uniref:Uncharacterized protein n=1 Tax=viral metagenome TaxID=1070528 RepID=A0A6C0KJ06_9ZZZZ
MTKYTKKRQSKQSKQHKGKQQRKSRSKSSTKKTTKGRRHYRKRTTHKTHKNKRGGGCRGQSLPPVPFVPPGGMYIPGGINGLDSGYYYGKLCNPILPDPVVANNYQYKVQKGGNVLPRGLVDLGRNVEYKLKTLYDNYMGEKPSASPDVMNQPIDKETKVVYINPPNIPQILNKSAKVNKTN